MIFTKGLAKQLAPKGIRVNAIAPGPVWTPLQVTGAQPTRKYRPLAKTRRWAVLASLRNWRPFTCCLRLPNPVTRPVRCSPRRRSRRPLKVRGQRRCPPFRRPVEQIGDDRALANYPIGGSQPWRNQLDRSASPVA